jgi:hypothetical protein
MLGENGVVLPAVAGALRGRALTRQAELRGQHVQRV